MKSQTKDNIKRNKGKGGTSEGKQDKENRFS